MKRIASFAVLLLCCVVLMALPGCHNGHKKETQIEVASCDYHQLNQKIASIQQKFEKKLAKVDALNQEFASRVDRELAKALAETTDEKAQIDFINKVAEAKIQIIYKVGKTKLWLINESGDQISEAISGCK